MGDDGGWAQGGGGEGGEKQPGSGCRVQTELTTWMRQERGAKDRPGCGGRHLQVCFTIPFQKMASLGSIFLNVLNLLSFFFLTHNFILLILLNLSINSHSDAEQ